MTKRPSKLELYTCCILMWLFIVVALIFLLVTLTGGPNIYNDGLVPVFAALYWRKDIEVREVRWAAEQTLLVLAEEIA